MGHTLGLVLLQLDAAHMSTRVTGSARCNTGTRRLVEVGLSSKTGRQEPPQTKATERKVCNIL